MKPLQGDSVNRNSCSSTSCDTKFESDRQTFKRLLLQGSKINKLLTGKYSVHLRESDLLDKLIKTRALYDALRIQLDSSNESSTADLLLRQSSREIKKAFVEAKKSSDIFDLMDLVDKRALIGLRKLSECCSCCTYSKFRLNGNMQKGRRNRQVYPGGITASRASLVTKQESSEAKNIKSDPCTCACFKMDKNNKTRELLENNRSKNSINKLDRFFIPLNNPKLVSINNGKLRKSYYKLKRGKAFPSPYMEDIGEGGNGLLRKSKLTSNTIKQKDPIELITSASEKGKYSFGTDLKATQKKEYEAISTGKNTKEENTSLSHKTGIMLKDNVERKRQVQSPDAKQRPTHRSRKINQALEDFTNINNISSKSSIKVLKEIPFTTDNQRQTNHPFPKKHIRITFAGSHTEIAEKLRVIEETFALNESNQVDDRKEKNIKPLDNPEDVIKNIKKMFPFSVIPENKLISDMVTVPGIQNPVSISWIKKRRPDNHKKLLSNSFKINHLNLKKISSSLFRKKISLLSAPLRLRPRPQMSEVPRYFEEPDQLTKPRHIKELNPCEKGLQEAPRLSVKHSHRKKPPNTILNNNMSGTHHGLKRCLCSIKLKTNETKSRVSKYDTNRKLHLKYNQKILLKSLLSSITTLTKASNDNFVMLHNLIKYPCPEYINQSITIPKNTQATQNASYSRHEKKNYVSNDSKLIQRSLTELSINALISDCVCKEVEQFMYKHYSPSNNKIEGKFTSNHHTHTVLDEKLSSEEIGKTDRGKSNSTLKIKLALKNASITTEKPWKLQHQSVQTVINSTSKKKGEKSLKKLDKKNTDPCSPELCTYLLNKGYFNDRLRITQSKVKIMSKCSIGTKILPQKQSQKSTRTKKKHGLRRCTCTLKLGNQETNCQREFSKISIIQSNSPLKACLSQTKLKLAGHVILPYEYDLSLCSPEKCFSRQMIKKEKIKTKNHNRTKVRQPRFNFGLISRSMQIPRAGSIHSVLISQNSEMLTSLLKKNKTKSPYISTHRVKPNNLRQLCSSNQSSWLCPLINKAFKIKKYTKIDRSKDNEYKYDIKRPYNYKLLENTNKEEQSMLLELNTELCLRTLNLHKNRKKYKKITVVNTNGKSNIIDKQDSKITKPIYSNLLNKCKCHPDEYFEKNKRNTSKQFAIVAEKSKMESNCSDIHILKSLSKLLLVKSDFQQRNPSMQKFNKLIRSTESSHLPLHVKEMYLHNILKQGSNFRLNIEFYKSVTPESKFYQRSTKNMNIKIFNKKQEGLLNNRYSYNRMTHFHSKKVSQMPERCYCTKMVSFVSKMDERRRNSELLLPFETKQLTQVNAMSTVANVKNKFKTPEIKVDHHCINSYQPTSHSRKASSDSKQWQYIDKNPTCGFSISMNAFKTKNIQSYIRESKYKLLSIKSREQSLLDFASNKAIRFESAFSCEVDYLKNISSKKETSTRSAQSQNDSLALSQHYPSMHNSQLNGVQPLLRRCYCTMNIQVARHNRKLLDYECEPGICIPGECDPYECQKLIMKRLMRKVSRMTGTDSRSRSSASETSSTSSRSRRLQSGVTRKRKYRTRGHYARSRPTRPQGLKYQTFPRVPQSQAQTHAHRQAVKVGSNFSFDIEFSKGSSKSAPPTATGVVNYTMPKRHTSSRSSTTLYIRGQDRGTRYRGGRHHKETQSMMKQMRHRASSVTPMFKRCFCTLKLQKKGRQQKELELRSINHGTSTPTNFSVESPILRTTERGQNTRRRRKLLPYECEPGICIPGECDPYDCLELIKKRNKHTKDFGTDSMASSISSSSMTSGQKRKKKRIQARNIRPKQVRSSYTSVRPKPSVISIDTMDRQGQDRQQTKPSRQAVKISSNFSFNIEFYKDKTGLSKDSDRRPSEVYVHKAPKDVRRVPKNVYTQRRMREGSSQSGTSSRDDVSQIGIFQRGQSTMTSGFPRRCFCTAKLQGYNIDAATAARRPPSKLKRCFCTLKLLSKRHRIKDGGVGHERATSVAMTQTRRRGPPFGCVSECEAAVKTQTKERFSSLLPYECEPGVCEPGYCDPYECMKLIRKRLAKEKMIGTERPRTRSRSSYFSSSYPSRAKMTQYRSVWPKSRDTQSRIIRRRARGRRRNYASTESVIQETIVTPKSPQRQAVRIGSNFSFNIEFYKDKSPNNLEVQTAVPVVKKYRPVFTRDRGHGAYRRIRTRDRGLRRRRFPSLNRDSQVDSIQSRDIGLGPMLRRCFCTLQLQRKKKKKGKAEIKVESIVKKKTESKLGSKNGSKAETSADIKAVNKAEKKTETKAETGAEIKAESKAKKKTESKAEKKTDSKDETSSDTKTNKKAESKAKRKIETSAEKKTESKAESSAGVTAEAKVDTKTEQKETESQNLKKTNLNNKCLCEQTTPTIKDVETLHGKSITTSKKPKESIMASKKSKESVVALKKSKRKIIKRRKAFPYKLEPYECEPGICVPGECDPYECLKLINKRLMYSTGTSTAKRRTRSSSNMAVCKNRDCEAQSFIQRKKQMRTRNTYTRYREKRPHRYRRPHRDRSYYRERIPYRKWITYKQRKPAIRSVDVVKPSKQAVKLGSNFKLDIEFSKKKSYGGTDVVTSKPINQYVEYDKLRRTSSRSTDGRPSSYRNKKAQRYRDNRDMDSQALGPSMRSRMTGTVAPFLKRCFCTLQFHCKTENQRSPFDCLVNITKSGELQSNYVKSQSSQFTVKSAEKNNYSRKHAQYADRIPCPKLLPYECEPGFCVPGECDPYECLKRIKRRMQSKQVGTIYRSRSFSSSTGEGKKYRRRRMQTRSSTPRRKYFMTSRRNFHYQDDSRSRSISSSSDARRKYRRKIQASFHFPNRKKGIRYDDQFQDDTSSYKNVKVKRDPDPRRQAVSIGSNFSLDIEFFKDKSQQPQNNYIAQKAGGKKWSTRKERLNMPSDESYYERRKRARRRTMARSISTNSISSYDNKYYPRNIQSQSEFKRTYSKGMGTPLLRRCFCTLKLEKKGRLWQNKRKNSRLKIEPSFKCVSKKIEPSFKCVSKKLDPSFKCLSKKMEPKTKSVSTHTKSKIKAITEPVAREIGIKPKTCLCDKGPKGNKCKCKSKNSCECNKKNKNCKCYERCECVEEIPLLPPKQPSLPFTCKTSNVKENNQFPCKKGKDCKCCKCNTYFSKTSEYRCKKGAFCKCPICNTPAFEPNENIIYLKQDQKVISMKQDQKIIPTKQDEKIIPVNQDTCRCYKSKNKCKCNTQKRRECLCETVSQKIMSVKSAKKDPNIISVKQDNFPCKKGIECKCCKCNNSAVEPNEFPCKKGKKCKCCKCNPPGLEQNDFPCKKGKKCICCKCNPPGLEPNDYPCKKGKECECCRCNSPGQESNEFPCKKGKNCKCCRCKTPLTKDRNNSLVKQNEFPCKAGKECKCAKCKCYSPDLEPKEFPCKKGKNCKCCKCNPYVMKTSEYRCKKGEVCQCPICNTPAFEQNENITPMKQDQKIIPTKTVEEIIPVNQDKCRCNQSKNKCKCNTQKPSKCLCDKGSKGHKCKCEKHAKNKNCKCFESCECVAEIPPPPPSKTPSIPFTCKPSKQFTCKPSKQFTCNPSTPFTCKTSRVKMTDKKTSTKKKYDPFKQLNIPDECGVCETPYECLKKGIGRLYRTSRKRAKRHPRMSVSSIAATIVPGYTHRRIKYKGEPYSPDRVNRIVEEPRYPFLNGKDARQGVKISSNFSFNIEFFKDMLPPVMGNNEETDDDSSPSHRKGRRKNRIKEYYQYGDSRSTRHGARNYLKYGNESQSELDRKSSPFEMLKKCFCTTKLHKSKYIQHVNVGRTQEIRPRTYFGPKEYLIQYQIQQPTRTNFETNSQEIESLTSYVSSKYDKACNNVPCYCCRKYNFGHVDSRKQVTQGGILKHAETKQSPLKSFTNYCKNLFMKPFSKLTSKDTGCKELNREVTYKHPLIDILKASKSERYPNKLDTTDIKLSKSVKVSKISENNNYKNIFSSFQSGDQYGCKSQNTGINLVRKKAKNCHSNFKQTNSKQDKVRFPTLQSYKLFGSKLNEAILITHKKKDPKSVSCLFKSLKFQVQSSGIIPDIKVCPCCGGIQRERDVLSTNILFDKNNKILECRKGIVTTITPQKQSALPQGYKEKYKRGCRFYNCQSNSKLITMPCKNDDLSIYKTIIYKDPKGCAENTHHAKCIKNKREKRVCGTTICHAKSEIAAFTTGFGYKLASNLKESNEKLKQNAQKCKYFNDKKGQFKKLMKSKSSPGTLAESALCCNKVGVSNTVYILRYLRRTVSNPKSTFPKCQSYLCDHMHIWGKFQKAYDEIVVETLQRFKLRCQTRKRVKEAKDKFEERPVTDYAKNLISNRKKEIHAKRLAWRSHTSSVFGWSPFMLSLRKRPWLSAYYKYAGFFPHCLTILQVWRQCMDIILFILAVAAVSPCLLCIELCRALKSCLL